MRKAIVLLAMLFSVMMFASNSNWQDAKVVNITNGDSGTAVMASGNTLIGAPVSRLYFWIQTDKMTYVVARRMRSLRKGSPDLTLNGTTKIAVDGKSAHVVEDSGKQCELEVIEKIARN